MKWAESPKKLSERCAVIVMSLSDDQAVTDIINGSDGLLSGSITEKVIIDMSTISPEVSRKLASEVRDNRGYMLDAPISGNPIAVKEGKTIIMVGGNEDSFIKTKPILEAMSPKVFYIGENGHALYLKLAININLAAQFYAFSESMLLAQKAGLDLKKAIEISTNSFIASPNIQQRAAYILSPPEEQLFSIKLMQKDILLALEQGRKLGVPLLNAAITNEALTTANALDYGDKDLSILFKSMQQIIKNDKQN